MENPYKIVYIKNLDLLSNRISQLWYDGYEIVSCIQLPHTIDNGYTVDYTLTLICKKRNTN
ncbi:MAG: hypothetical protein EOM11_09670 [Erysipelotrichia bacterium]|nr:hypothetical protein [Erysipelotrichia bacterium]